MEFITLTDQRGSLRASQKTSPQRWWLQLGFIATFLMIFLFSARLLVLRRSNARPVLAAIPAQAGDLPSQLGPWRVIKFDHKVLNDEFAPESSIWTLQQGSRRAIVSIDGPYPEYHTINICYEMTGWAVAAQYDYDPAGRWDSDQLNATTVEMSKPDANGLVLFTAVDRHGELVQATQLRHAQGAISNIKSVLGLDLSAIARVGQRGAELPIYQIQVLYQSEVAITPAEHSEIEALFREARQAFLSMERFQEEPSA